MEWEVYIGENTFIVFGEAVPVWLNANVYVIE